MAIGGTINITGTIPEYLIVAVYGNSVMTEITEFPYTFTDTRTYLYVYVKKGYETQYTYDNNTTYTATVRGQTVTATKWKSTSTYWTQFNQPMLEFSLPNYQNVSVTLNMTNLEPTGLAAVPTQYKLAISGTLENCSCNYQVGEILDVGTVIKITTTNALYHFYRADIKQYSLKINGSSYVMSTNTSSELYYPTVLSRTLPSIPTDATGDYCIVDLYDTYLAISQYTNIVINITGSWSNCTCNYANDEQYTEGKSLIITANDGYHFNTGENPISLINTSGIATQAQLVLSEDTKSLSYTLTESDFEVYQSIDINTQNITAYRDTPAGKYILNLTGTLTNCTCNYTTGTELSAGSIIRISATYGYEFTSNYQLTIGDTIQYFNKSADLTELYYTLSYEVDTDTEVLVQQTITATKKATTTVAFTSVYNPTDGELDSLTSKLIVYVGTDNQIDYSEYIHKLYIIPFDVSNLRLEDKQNIILRNYDTTIKSYQLNNWKFEVNGGDITVPYKYNNAYDFLNTECSIYIPFVDIVKVDNKYIIGQTVSLTYEVNLYNGFVVAYLKSTLTNNYFYSQKMNIGLDLPYYSANPSSNEISELAIPKTEKVFNPFITVERKVPKPVNGIFGKRNHFYTQMKSLSGFNVIEDIALNADFPQNLENEIRQLLLGGVYL